MRATIVGGILLGLTTAFPHLAILLWHTTTWTAAVTGVSAGWVLQQPAGVAAVLAVVAWRHLTKRGRRRTA